MVDSRNQSGKQGRELSVFELVPALASLVIGFYVGQLVFEKTQSIVLSVVAGLVSVPIAFIVVAYSFAIIVAVPIILISMVPNRVHPRDEFFDDL